MSNPEKLVRINVDIDRKTFEALKKLAEADRRSVRSFTAIALESLVKTKVAK